MKKVLSVLLASTMTMGMLAGCGGTAATATTEAATQAPSTSAETTAPAETTAAAADTTAAAKDAASITLWTYPIGSWKDSTAVDGFVQSFNKQYPDIKVKVEYLDYTTGDDQVTAAIEAGTTPDIIMEGPERLVSNWGAKGKMVDLSDLWTSEATQDINATSKAIETACTSTDGAKYEYPLCMTTHTMAINKEVFEKAGALQYLDLDKRTWTTENFAKALKAVTDSKLVQSTGVVYCGGQGGDQGTRALAMNLYNASFTNPDHTKWTMNSPEGIKGLQALVDWTKQGILGYDAGIQAADELQLFANGTIAMTLAWNASNEANYASQVKFTPYAMAFPSENGTPQLAGGIWGFGIFNNNDQARVDAAKKFITFMCDDKTQGPLSVQATGFFPVRSSFGNVYAGTANEDRMAVYASFQQYLGDYYNVTPGWAEQRTAWWNMLQKIFNGTDVTQAANAYVETSNAATAAADAK